MQPADEFPTLPALQKDTTVYTLSPLLPLLRSLTIDYSPPKSSTTHPLRVTGLHPASPDPESGLTGHDTNSSHLATD